MMYEIPQFLKTQLHEQYGSTADLIEQGYGCERRTSLRVNTLKTSRSAVCDALKAAGIPFETVPWYDDALVLPSAYEPHIRDTELYERGEIYLQSLSSMLPPLVLDPQEGESILDMTAAPGGKTTQICALAHGKALVTACEQNKIRFQRLQYNVAKQGAQRVTLMQTDASGLNEFFRFDKILLDAPCSGSGIVDLKAPVKITEKLISACVRAQESLLKKALSLLKAGGTLVYSTCSVLCCENEDVLNRALAGSRAKIVPIGLNTETFPLLPSNGDTVCLCPNEMFEGFFVAKIQKF